MTKYKILCIFEWMDLVLPYRVEEVCSSSIFFIFKESSIKGCNLYRLFRIETIQREEKREILFCFLTIDQPGTTFVVEGKEKNTFQFQLGDW